ncbi:MAG: alpha/beta fold hydrolase [Dehalococcoidia bacterium]|nr:alpha/beta fold hydrolase [Dehalococcoidia bacterium]
MLTELWSWLLRIGYQPYFSHIGPNIDCPNATATDVVENVRRAHRETGKPVTIIGHSLGGMLARSAALNHPEYVKQIISLASPFRDHVRAHPAVLAAIDSIRAWGRGSAATSNIHPTCFSGHCTCDFVKNVLKPEGFAVPRYAIYSRTDGVVDWESCLEADDRLNVEVNATHIGMVFNVEVYCALAGLLAGKDC